MGFHGYPRLTMDFDLLFDPEASNAIKIISALNEFGFGDCGIKEAAFTKEGTAITLGVQPNQINLLTSVSKSSTHDIFKNAIKGKLEDFDVLFISLEDLLACKKASSRPKDLADVDELNKIMNDL